MASSRTFKRTDAAFPSHPGAPYYYPTHRVPERAVTQDAVTQYVGPAGSGAFSGLSNVLNDATANTVLFSWTWDGDSSATFDVYVDDGTGTYVLATTTAAGATSYTFTSHLDLTTNRSDPTANIGFYVQALLGETLGPQSTPVVTAYNHA